MHRLDQFSIIIQAKQSPLRLSHADLSLRLLQGTDGGLLRTGGVKIVRRTWGPDVSKYLHQRAAEFCMAH